MSIFRTLFLGAANPFETDENSLRQKWQEYVRTVHAKQAALHKPAGAERIKLLRQLLKVDFVDVEEESKTLDHLQAEVLIREHARGIKDTQGLLNSLYHEETIYDFIHALLAHLSLTLQKEWHILELAESKSIDEAEFLRSFQTQINDELDTIRVVDKHLSSFFSKLGEMLRGERGVKLISEKARSIAAQFRRALLTKDHEHTEDSQYFKNTIHNIHAYVQHQEKAIKQSGALREKIAAEDLHEDHIDLWIINQPSFREIVSRILHEEYTTVDEDDLDGVIAVFREYYHHLHPQILHEREHQD